MVRRYHNGARVDNGPLRAPANRGRGIRVVSAPVASFSFSERSPHVRRTYPEATPIQPQPTFGVALGRIPDDTPDSGLSIGWRAPPARSQCCADLPESSSNRGRSLGELYGLDRYLSLALRKIVCHKNGVRGRPSALHLTPATTRSLSPSGKLP